MSVPLTVDSTRFECWELQYADGDEAYDTAVNEHWGRLKGVVGEDVEEILKADMEAELGALERGNGQSRRRLHGGAPITDLLLELEEGTDRANRIVRAAILRQVAR